MVPVATVGPLTAAQQVLVDANWQTAITRVGQTVLDRREMVATCVRPAEGYKDKRLSLRLLGNHQTPLLGWEGLAAEKWKLRLNVAFVSHCTFCHTLASGE